MPILLLLNGTSFTPVVDTGTVSPLDVAYTIEIGWETAVQGTIRCDVSPFDGSDVFANAFTNFFTGTLDDVTSDVDTATASISRGRDRKLGPIGAGTFDFTLSRPNDVTFYDPNSPSSPLHALTPGFVPMRPVRVRATVLGITYPRYYGFIRSAVYDPYTRLCRVHAEDVLLWLSRVAVTVGPLTNTTTQAVIGAILDAAGWNDPAMRSLSNYGDAIASYPQTTGNALDLINALIEADRGLVYADASGRFVYEDRNARSRRTSAKAVFVDQQLVVDGDGTSGIDLDEILNQAVFTGADSIPATAANGASEQNYGTGSETVSSDFIPDAATALLRAQWEVAQLATPRSPMTATLDVGSLPFLYNLDLQDRLRVSNTLTGSSDDYHLERLDEALGESSLYTTVRLTLSKRGLGGFIFDSSALDGADVFVA